MLGLNLWNVKVYLVGAEQAQVGFRNISRSVFTGIGAASIFINCIVLSVVVQTLGGSYIMLFSLVELHSYDILCLCAPVIFQ